MEEVGVRKWNNENGRWSETRRNASGAFIASTFFPFRALLQHSLQTRRSKILNKGASKVVG